MCEARGPGRSAVGRPPESKNRPGTTPPPARFDTSPSRPDRPSRPGFARGNGLPALARVCAGATELPWPRRKHSSSVTLLVQGVNRGCNQGSIIQPEILCIMYYTYDRAPGRLFGAQRRNASRRAPVVYLHTPLDPFLILLLARRSDLVRRIRELISTRAQMVKWDAEARRQLEARRLQEAKELSQLSFVF